LGSTWESNNNHELDNVNSSKNGGKIFEVFKWSYGKGETYCDTDGDRIFDLTIPENNSLTIEVFVESGQTRILSATFDAQSVQNVNCVYKVTTPRVKTIYKSLMEIILGR
jgi:hypothetical protein